MKSLQTICLLFIFIARGTSHRCEVCHGTGNNCDGYVRECISPEEQCGKVLLETSLACVSVRTVHKNCFSSSLCKLGHVDINVGKGIYIRAKINCCDEEECKGLPLPGLPLSYPNGFHCPGAIGIFSEDSTEHEAVCRGSEKMCIDIVGYRQERYPGNFTYNIKGCVSSCPLLNLSNRTHEYHTNDLKKIECTNAIQTTHS